jgi:hypothetical protein
LFFLCSGTNIVPTREYLANFEGSYRLHNYPFYTLYSPFTIPSSFLFRYEEPLASYPEDIHPAQLSRLPQRFLSVLLYEASSCGCQGPPCPTATLGRAQNVGMIRCYVVDKEAVHHKTINQDLAEEREAGGHKSLEGEIIHHLTVVHLVSLVLEKPFKVESKLKP